MGDHNFSGVWRCTHWYPSNKRPGEEEHEEHLVLAHQRGNKLVFESLPDDSKSYMLLRLSVEDNLVSGSWHENTLPSSEYKSAMYSGVVQMIYDPVHKTMEGKWAGVGDDNGKPDIFTGRWQIVFDHDTQTAQTEPTSTVHASN